MNNTGGTETEERPRGRGRPRRDVDGVVLAATQEALGRVGYANLSVDAIAETCGIAKATIYRRWATKPILVTAAVEALDTHASPPPDNGDLRADLLELLEASFGMVVTADNIYESLIRNSAGHPELTDVIRRRTSARRDIYRTVVNRAIARGELPPEVDVDDVFDHLYGPLWFRILVSGRPPDELRPEQLVETVLHAFDWQPPGP